MNSDLAVLLGIAAVIVAFGVGRACVIVAEAWAKGHRAPLEPFSDTKEDQG